MKTLSAAILAALFCGSAVAADVEFQTSKGAIVIRVDEEKAPLTAANFLNYVKDGFYDGLIFHRVIPGFVIQGGGFTETMYQGEFNTRQGKPPIKNEASNGLKNLHYSLSMARTNDPDSATSQFFVNLQDNPNLDPTGNSAGYAVFGKVVKGQDVVNAIAAVETTQLGPFRDVPAEAVVITKAVVMKKEAE